MSVFYHKLNEPYFLSSLLARCQQILLLVFKWHACTWRWWKFCIMLGWRSVSYSFPFSIYDSEISTILLILGLFLKRLTGSSGACETFGNLCLAHDQEFELKNVEVFLFFWNSIMQTCSLKWYPLTASSLVYCWFIRDALLSLPKVTSRWEIIWNLNGKKKINKAIWILRFPLLLFLSQMLLCNLTSYPSSPFCFAAVGFCACISVPWLVQELGILVYVLKLFFTFTLYNLILQHSGLPRTAFYIYALLIPVDNQSYYSLLDLGFLFMLLAKLLITSIHCIWIYIYIYISMYICMPFGFSCNDV